MVISSLSTKTQQVFRYFEIQYRTLLYRDDETRGGETIYLSHSQALFLDLHYTLTLLGSLLAIKNIGLVQCRGGGGL